MTKTENQSIPVGDDTPSSTKLRWNQLVQFDQLSDIEKEYLSQWTGKNIPQLDEIWSEMDRVWVTLRLNNSKSLADQNINNFYSHPVWLLNGVFTAFDPESRQHRTAIAQKITELGCERVADFGGGFGELAKYISISSPHADIDIIEPFPSDLGKYLIKQQVNVRFSSRLSGQYDCLIAQDVLEHLEDPIELVTQLVQATSLNGYIIFANCFKPVIKCHLPSTFHLRHTFRWVVQPLGLEFCGNIKGAEHAQLFQLKFKKIDFSTLQKRVSLSKIIDPWLNNTCSLLNKLKKITYLTRT